MIAYYYDNKNNNNDGNPIGHVAYVTEIYTLCGQSEGGVRRAEGEAGQVSVLVSTFREFANIYALVISREGERERERWV